jgi:hypothetical protein
MQGGRLPLLQPGQGRRAVARACAPTGPPATQGDARVRCILEYQRAATRRQASAARAPGDCGVRGGSFARARRRPARRRQHGREPLRLHPHLSKNPRTIREAMRGPYAEQSSTVCDKDLDMLFYKGTFVPVRRDDLPPATPLLASVTVLRPKLDYHCNIAKRKARLNLNGNQQQPGVDFDADDLYSP